MNPICFPIWFLWTSVPRSQQGLLNPELCRGSFCKNTLLPEFAGSKNEGHSMTKVNQVSAFFILLEGIKGKKKKKKRVSRLLLLFTVV